MVVRIAVDNADSAKSLVPALFGVFGGESVSLDAGTNEVPSARLRVGAPVAQAETAS